MRFVHNIELQTGWQLDTSYRYFFKYCMIIAFLVLLVGCESKKKDATDADETMRSPYGNAPTDLRITDVADLYPLGYDSTIPQGTEEDLKKNIGDRIFFETDSTSLNRDAIEILTYQAKWIRYYDIPSIQIEGHADERGTREYNLALSARRANVVKNFLITQGVLADIIKTSYYGKERPVSLCDAVQCWSKNRRAVTLLK